MRTSNNKHHSEQCTHSILSRFNWKARRVSLSISRPDSACSKSRAEGLSSNLRCTACISCGSPNGNTDAGLGVTCRSAEMTELAGQHEPKFWGKCASHVHASGAVACQ